MPEIRFASEGTPPPGESRLTAPLLGVVGIVTVVLVLLIMKNNFGPRPLPPAGSGAPKGATAAAPVLTVNESNPGERVSIDDHVVAGKYTVFDFYSDGCPPCRRIAPLLERLPSAKPEIVLRRVDINRRGSGGIDWASPVVQQYSLRSVPYFVVYDPSGRKSAEGDAARSMVSRWLDEAGIR